MPKDYKVRILPNARQDLLEIASYVALDNPEAARKVHGSLIEKIRGLATFPNMGAIVADLLRMTRMEIRRVVVKPYTILYCVIGEIVYVYRVIHQSRDVDLVGIMLDIFSNDIGLS